MKKSLPSPRFPIPLLGGETSLYLSNAIWKTLVCFTFQSRGVEIIFTHFSVWLWTMTQFNTSINEMSLKVLLVTGNEFLIPLWKHWIWISKNESILRTTGWNGIDYSSMQNWTSAYRLVSVTKYRLVYWINVTE